MFKRKIALVSVATMAAMAAGASGAQPAKRPASPAKSAPQHAQPIPRAEFLANMDTQFRRMDADRDGILTKREIESSQIAERLQDAQNKRNRLFASLDTNGDGMISPTEFTRMPVNETPPNAAPMLQRFDTNHDGSISLVEYRAGTLANFDSLDADKDGVVTPAEMKAAGINPQ